MKNYVIYMHRNKINNKVYIGQTCQKVERRWLSGYGYKSSPHFYSAIQKYGWNNFEHIILLENLSEKDANKYEKYFINLYDSTNSNKGYNILSGGQEKLQEYWSKVENKQKRSQERTRYFIQHPEKKQLINKNRMKKVKCIETQEIFESQAAAARAYNINPGNLGKHLNHDKRYTFCGKNEKGENYIELEFRKSQN